MKKYGDKLRFELSDYLEAIENTNGTARDIWKYLVEYYGDIKFKSVKSKLSIYKSKGLISHEGKYKINE